MIRQIVIEAEPADDSQPVFRLSINANLIAKGVTAGQAYYLVGEILRRIGPPEHAETVMFDAERDASESVRVPGAQAERREEAELGSSQQDAPPRGNPSTLTRRVSCKRTRDGGRPHFGKLDANQY